MNPGEHIFNNLNHSIVNKSLIDSLFASAIYIRGNKVILEILAPVSLFKDDRVVDYPVCDERGINNGDSWEHDIKNMSRWPLERANYELRVNDKVVGTNEIHTSYFRYEPEFCEEGSSKNRVGANTEEIFSKGNEELKQDDEAAFSVTAIADGFNKIFEDEDFKEAFSSILASMPPLNLDDPEGDDSYAKFDEERDRKERVFFNKFRNAVFVPEFLRDQPMAIIDLVFKLSDDEELNAINTANFVIGSYRKNHVIRQNIRLSFGELKEGIKIDLEEFPKLSGKIQIESITAANGGDPHYFNGVKDRLPKSKKAVYIVYETIDNVQVHPIFRTKEFLNGYITTEDIIDIPLVLQEKGRNDFNKYVSLTGFVDENVDAEDFELFQIVAEYTIDKDFKLI